MLNRIDWQLHIGDCAQVMREQIADGAIDLTLTSPPYDNLRKYNGYHFDFEAIAAELWRVTKPGGVVVWVVADATINGSETGTSFRQALHFMGLGFNLHDTMIYEKPNAPPLNHNRYDPGFEFMYVFSKGRPKTFNPLRESTKYEGTVKKRYLENKSSLDGGSLSRQRNEETVVKPNKYRKNVWPYPVGITHELETGIHTAVFPEPLARDHIISWSNPGDVVLDPMCGSGTTGKQAVLLGRNFIGIDISAEYIDEIARPRIQNAANQPQQLEMQLIY